MTLIVDHVSVEELGRRYRASSDACSARHLQAIWLLAQGRDLPDVAATTGMSVRWLERLVRRYNEGGPEALGDRRRGNGAATRILTPALLVKLRARLLEPPPDGGCGRHQRLRSGWRKNWGWFRCSRSGPGMRCAGSAGRSRSLVRVTRRRPDPRR